MSNTNEESAMTLSSDPPNDSTDGRGSGGEDTPPSTALLQHFVARMEHQDFDAVTALLQSQPELVSHVQQHVFYRQLNWTLLHWLCSLGGTPPELLELVASILWTTNQQEAMNMQESKFDDTALHLVARNSQLTAEKLLRVLRYSDASAVLIRNRSGGTALHSAASHNAVLPALQALVETNPDVLLVRTHDQTHAVTALWLAFARTIPIMGERIVVESDTSDAAALWDRFWAKVEYLALQYYWHKQLQRHQAETHKNHVLHGILQCGPNVPIRLFRGCLRQCPAAALAVDPIMGDLPIHVVVKDRPYRSKKVERHAIGACLKASAVAAGQPNHVGDVPLHIALRSKISWHHGLDLRLEACPDVIQRRDAVTGLYPVHFGCQCSRIGNDVSPASTST